MTDPTAMAAQTALTGASALVFAALGVEPQALVWALVGSTLGLSLAKPAGMAYSIALFVAASLTCALLGTMISAQWFGGGAVARNTFAVILGAAFHPLFASFIDAVPGFVQILRDFVAKRIGGQQ